MNEQELRQLRMEMARFPEGFCRENQQFEDDCLVEKSPQMTSPMIGLTGEESALASQPSETTADADVSRDAGFSVTFTLPYDNDSLLGKSMALTLLLVVFLAIDWAMFGDLFVQAYSKQQWLGLDRFWLVLFPSLTLVGSFLIVCTCVNRTMYRFEKSGITISTGPFPWWHTERIPRNEIIEVYDDFTRSPISKQPKVNDVAGANNIGDHHQVWLRTESQGQAYHRPLFQGLITTDDWLLRIPSFCNAILRS